MTRITVRDEGEVRWVGLNRPEKRNAIDMATADELIAALDQARKTPCVLIVHSATPGMFAAGADIAELRDRDADAALLAINAGVFEKLEAHRWPTIAVVDGPALGGGCELALACDFRIASHNAYFGQPELSLGILAGAGGNWRLAQTAGQQVARRMLYAGARLSAAEALAAALVDEVADDPDAAARTLAAKITRQSWRALELTKLALRSHRPATTTFDMAAQALLFESQDKHDRMTAFLNRRRTLAGHDPAAGPGVGAARSRPAARSAPHPPTTHWVYQPRGRHPHRGPTVRTRLTGSVNHNRVTASNMITETFIVVETFPPNWGFYFRQEKSFHDNPPLIADWYGFPVPSHPLAGRLGLRPRA